MSGDVTPEAFREAIKRALAHGISRETIAREFSCPLPTVYRWETGMAVPHPLMRRAIVAALADL